MLLVTLGASWLGNLLAGRGAIATSQRRGIYRAGKGKGKGIVKLVMEIIIIIIMKWIFNTASSFNKLWNTKI